MTAYVLLFATPSVPPAGLRDSGAVAFIGDRERFALAAEALQALGIAGVVASGRGSGSEAAWTKPEWAHEVGALVGAASAL